jgi:hypothetical protein
MTLYSKFGAYPAPLPNKITFPSGGSRTDKSTFTEEEIALAGYIAAPEKPPVPYPNKLQWTGDAWEVVAPNGSDINKRWREVREIRDKKLSWTDYEILKAYEQGQPVDPTLAAYRQALRDIPQNNADPFFITWPSLPEE